MTLPSDDPERGRTGVAPGVPGRSAILTVVLGYAAFASAKFGLRAVAQAMARRNARSQQPSRVHGTVTRD